MLLTAECLVWDEVSSPSLTHTLGSLWCQLARAAGTTVPRCPQCLTRTNGVVRKDTQFLVRITRSTRRIDLSYHGPLEGRYGLCAVEREKVFAMRCFLLVCAFLALFVAPIASVYAAMAPYSGQCCV